MIHESHGHTVARVLFMAFAYVADHERRIESSDIERFTSLMSSTDRTTHPAIANGLRYLRDQYESLWAEYEAAKAPVQLDALCRRTLAAMSVMPDHDVEPFKTALVAFVRRATPVASAAFAVLHLSAAGQRRQALKDVELAFERAAAVNARRAIVARDDANVTASQADAPQPQPRHDASVRLPVSRAPAAQVPAATAQPATAVWTGGKIAVRCIRVNDETHDVKTFTFASAPARQFVYKPGQFATLELDIDGKLHKRSYTMSSSPSRPHTLSVTVKRVPGGRVSNWLHDHMIPGSTLALSGPYGKFDCTDVPAKKLLLVSGGSGVTPMMSMLRWFADMAAPADIVFVNNVRTPADIIFEAELHHLATRLGDQLRLLIVPGALAPARSWIGGTGRIGASFLQSSVPDLNERTTFLCGPQPYMDIVAATLRGLDYPMHWLHSESFGGAPTKAVANTATRAAMPAETLPTAPAIVVPAPAPLVAHATVVAAVAAAAASPVHSATRVPASVPAAPSIPSAAAGIAVTLQTSGRSFSCGPNETVLEAAERCGIDLEHACRSGRCGACKVQIVSGRVHMDDQDALDASDLESGYTLPCVGRATTSLVLAA